jgi:hypothetical protein
MQIKIMAFRNKIQTQDTTEQDNISVVNKFLSSQLDSRTVRGERHPNGNYVFKTSMMVEYNPKTTTYTLGFTKWELTPHEFYSVVNVLLNGEHHAVNVFTKFNNKFKVDLGD